MSFESMKKTNWYYSIEWRIYKSIESIAIFYWFELKEFNYKIKIWESIESILWLWWYAKEDFTIDDIAEINKHLYVYETIKYERWTFTRIQRRSIMKLHYNEFSAWDIAMKTWYDYNEVKEYLHNRECKLINDNKKICTACDKAKTLDKFWKTKTWVRAECAECINKHRRDKYKKDPVHRVKINKQCNDSYYRNDVNAKKIKRWDMTDEERSESQRLDRARGQKFRTKKHTNKLNLARILTDKI